MGVLIKGAKRPCGDGFFGGGGVGDFEGEDENGVGCLDIGKGANRG